MKVTIKGDLGQVCEAMGLPAEPPTPRVQRLAENKAKQKEFMVRRRIVVAAFKLARRDRLPQMEDLLEAIRRTKGVTDSDLKLARQVLAGAVPNGDRGSAAK